MPNTEYPKMLYSGDKESYSSRIVHSAEEEAQFRDIGLMDYADLPEPAPKNTGAAQGGGAGGEEPQGFITTEQFDAVAKRLAAAESEIERLKQGDTKTVDYSTFTKEELQALITQQGKTFKSADTKAELIVILGG